MSNVAPVVFNTCRTLRRSVAWKSLKYVVRKRGGLFTPVVDCVHQCLSKESVVNLGFVEVEIERGQS